jgi:hypothetical protein
VTFRYSENQHGPATVVVHRPDNNTLIDNDGRWPTNKRHVTTTSTRLVLIMLASQTAGRLRAWTDLAAMLLLEYWKHVGRSVGRSVRNQFSLDEPTTTARPCGSSYNGFRSGCIIPAALSCIYFTPSLQPCFTR